MNHMKKFVAENYSDTQIFQASKQGTSISMSYDGLTLATGAPEHDSGIGAVFVYVRQGIDSPWVQQGNRIRGRSYTGESNQGFSIVLSRDGNTLVSGGPGDNGGIGKVWIFKRIDNSWYERGDLIGPNIIPVPKYGSSVALSGDESTLAIGAINENWYYSTESSGNKAIGAVYIARQFDGIWKQSTRVIGGVRDGFKSRQGTSVSLSFDGMTLAVGCLDKVSPFSDIFVFNFYRDQWVEVDHEIFFGENSDYFQAGANIVLSDDGNTLIFGGYHKKKSSGCSWIFTRNNDRWTFEKEILIGATDKNKSYFIHDISLSKDDTGDHLAISVNSQTAGSYTVYIKNKRIGATGWDDVMDIIYSGRFVFLFYGVVPPVVISGNGLSFAFGLKTNNHNVGCAVSYNYHDTNWIVAPDIIGSDFIGRPGQGKSVLLSEDGLTMIIGGYMDMNGQGSVWIFTRDNVNSKDWQQSGEKLVPKDSIGQSKYGYSLALSSSTTTINNILVVGGPGDNQDRGAVWVYRKSHDGWVHQAKLVEFFHEKAEVDVGISQYQSQNRSSYGSSVAISGFYSRYGIRIVTGGPDDNAEMGGILVFDHSESGWIQSSKIDAITSGEASLGKSISITCDGKRIYAGCPMNGSGCVLSFYQYDKRIWVQDTEKIRGPESIEKSRQGSSIGMDAKGETLVIGGPGDDYEIGATWIFNRVNNRWEFKIKIVCPDSIDKSLQGSSVNLTKDGTHLIIGGPSDDNGLWGPQGAAWVYELLDENWTYLDEKYIGSLHKGKSAVGSSVAIAITGNGNPVIAFGGPLDDEGTGGVWITDL